VSLHGRAADHETERYPVALGGLKGSEQMAGDFAALGSKSNCTRAFRAPDPASYRLADTVERKGLQ
jgi:hypothetical protein